jgi:hypothetical protein
VYHHDTGKLYRDNPRPSNLWGFDENQLYQINTPMPENDGLQKIEQAYPKRVSTLIPNFGNIIALHLLA